MIVCENMRPDEYSQVVDLAVKVFMEDKFFIKRWPDEQKRYENLAEIYRDGLEICDKNFGGTMVAKLGGKIVGFLMYFDYVKFRKSNLADFKKIFGVEIQHNHVDPVSFAKIHRLVVKSKQNPVYVLAIGVGKIYQHKGIGKSLFADFLKCFEDRVIMSDISGPFFLRLCQKYGFDLSPISDVCYVAISK